eukprot:NODE_107_length_19843_cov_0.502077.p11 type:complete len:181 gc:universal NODE_107_length_19843_cov_0.502077:15330-15872(+)
MEQNQISSQFQIEYGYHQQPNFKQNADLKSSLLTPDESPQSLPTQQFGNMQPLTPQMLFATQQQQSQPSNYPYFDYSPRPYPITSPHALQPYYNQHQNIPYIKEDVKKQQHKLAEQRRRDDAKNALTNLRDKVPFAKERKMARVEILQAATLYIDYLESKLKDSVLESEFRDILTKGMPQ